VLIFTDEKGDAAMAPPKRPAHTHSARPRLQVGDLVMANGRAPGDYRGRRGLITEINDMTECRVEFDDGLQPTTGYLKAVWLDL